MIFNPDSIKPIYVQIAEWLEAEILGGNLPEGERIYSQYQLADMFTINPATAAKGLNLLADEGIVYKKRGLGMFVSPQAKGYILEKRKRQILGKLIKELVEEAQRLGVEEKELHRMIVEAHGEAQAEEQGNDLGKDSRENHGEVQGEDSREKYRETPRKTNGKEGSGI